MPKLIDNKLRADNLSSMLTTMDLDLKDTTIRCNGTSFVFQLKDQQKTTPLSKKLGTLLDIAAPKRSSFKTLISDAIQNSNSKDPNAELYKQTCALYLQSPNLDFSLDEEGESIKVNLLPLYLPFFKSLACKYITIQDNKLKFNLREFLQDNSQDSFCFEENKSTYLCVPTNAFEKKKVIYTEKKMPDNKVEVTPFFHVPHTTKPPKYVVVIDTSGSMDQTKNNKDNKETPLAIVKRNVISLSTAIFDFQPKAELQLIEFSDEPKKIGTYNAEQKEQLMKNVNDLSADNETCLYQVTFEQLNQLLTSSEHTNILLLTDGKDYITNSNRNYRLDLHQLKNKLSQSTQLVTGKNKFFVFSYGTEQEQIMHDLTQAFHCSVIESNNPSFLEALSDKGKLQQWAAEKDLFTIGAEVKSNNQKPYYLPFNKSGQFEKLTPIICTQGEILSLKITDSDGVEILNDQRQTAKNIQLGTPPSPQVMSKGGQVTTPITQVMSKMGHFTGVSDSKDEDFLSTSESVLH